jgi:hypothetical protein
MNRIIIQNSIFVVILLLTSCNPSYKKDERLTDYHYIINTTGKKIIHELPYIVPREYRDSMLRHYSEGSNAQQELEWTVSYVVGLTTEHTQAAIGYTDPFCLYNICDTTSLRWHNYWTQYDSVKVFCPFYWKPGGEMSDEKEHNRILNPTWQENRDNYPIIRDKTSRGFTYGGLRIFFHIWI